MLAQFIDKFDATVYAAWQSQVFNVLAQLEAGLKKLDFGDDIPEEVQKISDLIVLAKQENSRKELIQYIEMIKEQLNKLARRDFKNIAVNNFFFHSRRAFNWLASIVLTKNRKYGEAILYPAEKPASQEVGFIYREASRQSGQAIAKNLINNLEANVTAFLRMQVKSMSPMKVPKSADLSIIKSPTPLLLRKIGNEKYNQLKSQIQINNAENAAEYIAEQTYGYAFEFYFNHVALLSETLEKINKLAAEEEDPKAIKAKKQELLAECSLAELDTVEAQRFLDDLSQHLGFNSAKELKENYQKLDTEEGFNRLKKIKFQFMEFANHRVPLEQNPLHKMKVVARKEYERVLKKMNEDTFASKSAAYATMITYCGFDMISGLEAVQRVKNIAKLVAQDFLEPDKLLGEQRGFMQRMALQAVHFAVNRLNLKEYLDSYTLGIFVEGGLFERRLQESVRPITEQWAKNFQRQANEYALQREKLLKNANGDYFTENELMVQFLQYTVNYKNNLKELTRIDKRTDEANYLAKEKELESSRRDYINFRDAYHLKVSAHIRDLSQENLERYIETQKSRKESLVKMINEKILAIKEVQNREENLREKEKSVMGTLIRWRDWVAQKIGFETQSYRQRVQNKIDFSKQKTVLLKKIEEIGLNIEIHENLLSKAIAQKRHFSTFNRMDAPNLINNIKTLFADYVNKLNAHQVYDELENDLKIAALMLIEKLKIASELQKVSPHDLEVFYRDVQQIQEICIRLKGEKNLHPLIEPFDQIEKQLREIVQQNKKIAQENFLIQAKEKVRAIFEKSLEISDPYMRVLSEDIPINSLTQENRFLLYQHIQDEYIKVLPKLDRKQLQKLFFELQLGFHQHKNKEVASADNKALMAHYRVLSSLVNKHLDIHFRLNDLPFDKLREHLNVLDADFLHYHELIQKAKQKIQVIKGSYHSWIWNPFGWIISKNAIKDAANFELACIDQYNEFANRYSHALKEYLQIAPKYFLALNQDELINHIERLEHNARSLQALLKQAPKGEEGQLQDILSNYQQIISSAKKAEKDHIDHQVKIVFTEIRELELNLLKLNELAQSIDKDIITSTRFDIVKYASYHDLITAIPKLTNQINQKLEDIGEKYKQLESHYKALGKDLNERILAKNKLLYTLRDFSEKMKANQARYLQSFQFYENIVQGQVPESLFHKSINKIVLGKGLILAIEHNNQAAISEIFKAPMSIDIQDLASALKLAAGKGDVTSIEKILLARRDITFSDGDILGSIRAALESDQTEAAHFLFMNTDFKLNKEGSELLLSYMHAAPTQISPLEFGFAQLFVDKDGEILNDIRKCYIFQETLLKNLMPEFEQIQKRSQSIARDSEDFESLKKDILLFLAKLEKTHQIREKIASHYVDRHFENPERKNNQLSKWSKEISSIINEKYNHALNEILNPSVLKRDLRAELDRLQITLEFVDIQQEPILPAIPKVIKSPFQTKKEQLFEAISKVFNEANISSILIELRVLKKDDEFYQALSDAINKAAKDNKYEALDLLLSFIEEPHRKHEYAANALHQALDAGSEKTLKFLLSKKAYEANEQELIQQLWKIFQEKKEGQKLAKHLRFSQLALPILTNIEVPAAHSLDIRIKQMIDSAAPEDPTLIPVTRSWGVTAWGQDKDKQHLDDMRKSYLFCKHAFPQLTQDIYLDLRNPFDNLLLEHDLEDLPENVINQFERQLATMEASYKHQVNVINQLKHHYINSVKNNIESPKRMDIYIQSWEAALKDTVQKYEKSAMGDIDYVKERLSEYRKLKAQLPVEVEKPKKRRSSITPP